MRRNRGWHCLESAVALLDSGLRFRLGAGRSDHDSRLYRHRPRLRHAHLVNGCEWKRRTERAKRAGLCVLANAEHCVSS